MTRHDTLTVYRADDGWRWRYTSRNGKILANGGQAYTRRIDAIKSAGTVCGFAGITEGRQRFVSPLWVEFADERTAP
jgi:uncharacterized protein YegP (UPF0339 family)